MKLSLAHEGVASGLGVIITHMMKLEGYQKRITEGFAGWKGAIIGVGAVFAGGKIIEGFAALAEHAGKLSHAMTQIQKMGLTPAEYAGAQRAIFGAHVQVPGVTSTTAANIYGQTYGMLGAANAEKMLAPLLRFQQVLGAMSGDYEGAEKSINAMSRSQELMRKFMKPGGHDVDAGLLEKSLNLWSKIIAGTHGTIKPESILAVAQQAGPALGGMSEQGLLHMSAAMQAMGG